MTAPSSATATIRLRAATGRGRTSRALAAVILTTMAAIVWASACARSVRAEEKLEERRQRIEQMSAEKKNELRRHQDRFAAMDQADQDRLRQLAREIDQDPQGEQLRKIAQRYHEWVSRLPAERREELLELPPAERVKRVKDLKAQQLDPQDALALVQWMRQYGERNGPHIVTALREAAAKEGGGSKLGWLNRLQQGPQQYQWLAIAHFRMAVAVGNPPLTAAELADVRGKLSDDARRLMEGKTPVEQWHLLDQWLRQLTIQHFVRAAKGANDEKLMKFFEHDLSDADREMLFGLPPDEMQHRLAELYNAPGLHGSALQPGMGRDFVRGKKPPFGSPDGPPHPHGKPKKRDAAGISSPPPAEKP